MKLKNYYMPLLALLILVLLMSRAHAQNYIRWMQQPAVSPDAKWITFEYKGNIYKVSYQGGKAIQLTNEISYNGYPVWSHDGSKIAFASDRNGNFDVYIMSSSGMEPKRLTFNSSKDIPYEFSSDNHDVYFGTTRHDIYSSVRSPQDRFFLKLFKVSSAGGASLMVNSAGMEFAHFNHQGDRIIFQDIKGSVEDSYRKHATSSVTRDIWSFNTKTNVYTKLSPFPGEDREPLWGDGNDFYYLSERNGNQNLFKSSTADTGKIKQLTFFEKNPVRNLSRAGNGDFVFTYNGDMYTFSEGRIPHKIIVKFSEAAKDSIISIPVNGSSSDFDVSKDGKQIAFVMRGDVYVTSTDSSSVTRRITNTPYIERMVNFCPDGKKLLYSVEHAGSWDINQITIADPSEKYFYNAKKLNTTSIIAGSQDEFQGVYSPDGTKIAYLENREILKSYDVATKAVHTLLPYGINFSMRDGDQSFTWSPDSKSILVQHGQQNIILVSDDGSGKRINVTKSAFEDKLPHWGSSGSTMYTLSAKNGLTNFTRDQSQFDILETFFDKGAWDDDRLRKTEETSLRDSEKISTVFSDTTYHTKPLTSSPANINDFAVSRDGKLIYLLASYENNFNLYTLNIKSKEVHLFAKLNAQNPKMKLTNNGNTIVIIGNDNQFKTIDAISGKEAAVTINMKSEINITRERNGVYDHIYQLIKKRFMDPKLNGVDFEYYYTNYRQFLPCVNNNYDFKILVSELLGELNTSHLVPQLSVSIPHAEYTASLGLLYDLTRTDDGLLVKEVIAGGPFDNESTKMRTGMIIDQIDGRKITIADDWTKYLNNKIDSTLLISFHESKTGKQYEEKIRAIDLRDETYNLMEARWVQQMEHLTDSLSGGKIGYVYISQMDDDNFRSFYDKVLGGYADKKALIVDTRFNNGGDLLDLLISFLSGKTYLTERRQGHLTEGGEPDTKWTKPSCIIMNEANYSDAFRVPFIYKYLGLGKVIGMPAQGTGTAAVAERQLIPGFAIGVPQGGTYHPGDIYPSENHQLIPDILINDDYLNILNGEDQQIEAAVNELLKGMDKAKK
ncbi:S41 family peptidase [Mucilaginibacter sp. X5P1]|uniref:S41 family peptidase n=1 Tax=Mucilaginibacter sp. X5P1 TaxID=2723088 RepID=UPI00161349C4|nr:S41 family peptidase [Mucilaginibacter sp. X5P1]MBB6136879.1 Tol biopolymer transport system component [Mucilaginibacter sp. X5P1]